MDETHLLRSFRGKVGYCGHFRSISKRASWDGLRQAVCASYDSRVTAMFKKHGLGLSVAMLATVLVGCAAAQPVVQPWQAAGAEQFQQMVDVLAAPRMQGRGPGTAGLDLARDYLVEQYRDAGLKPVFGDSYVQRFEINNSVKTARKALAADVHGPKPGEDLAANHAGNELPDRAVATVYNVAGILPGAGMLKDQIVVIGAHYDHLGYGDPGSLVHAGGGRGILHPGADDNASGTAGLVMLAKRLANNDSPNCRTILFIAFTAEERGLVGSVHFLNHLKESGIREDQIVAMVNMDMIGRMDKNRLYVFGIKSGDGWNAMVQKAANDHGLSLMTKIFGLGASDHASFFLHKGPAVHFFTGLHVDYHRPSDTSDKINAMGGASTVACVQQVVSELITRQPRLVFNAAGAKLPLILRRASRGAFLGIMPDYASDISTMPSHKGCSIAAITPGSPASMAQLKAGDLIIEWDQHKISKVADLSKQLRKSLPQQTVMLKVKRADKLLDIPIKLGQR